MESLVAALQDEDPKVRALVAEALNVTGVLMDEMDLLLDILPNIEDWQNPFEVFIRLLLEFGE